MVLWHILVTLLADADMDAAPPLPSKVPPPRKERAEKGRLARCLPENVLDKIFDDDVRANTTILLGCLVV
jgi:hypothetical protein